MVTESDFDELGSFDESGPEPWKYASPGDLIKGVVTERKAITGKYGRKKCLIVDTPDGLYEVILGPAKLRRELAEDRDTQVGDKIAIRYDGEAASGSGGSFKDFSVLSSRKKRGASWDEPARSETGSGSFAAWDGDTPPDDPWDEDPGF